jgi:hypothetical protein
VIMLREGGRDDENFANRHEVTTTLSPSPQMGRCSGALRPAVIFEKKRICKPVWRASSCHA